MSIDLIRIKRVAMYAWLTVAVFGCRNDCTGEQTRQARLAIEEAFIQWRYSLDYMDEDLIADKKAAVDTAIARAGTCVVVNGAALNMMDSVSAWYSRASPVSGEMARAEELLTLIAGELLEE